MEKMVSMSPGTGMDVFMRGWRSSLGGQWTNLILGRLHFLRINPETLASRRYLSWQFAALGLEHEALAISEHPLPAVLSWLGKPGDAVTTAEARLAEDPISLTARRDLGLALAGAGDYTRARPILEDMGQRSGGRVTLYGLFRWDSAAALIAVHREAGEEAEVSELVTAIRDNARRYREAGIIRAGPLHLNNSVDYEEGLADFLAGGRERGLALIAKGAEDGFFIPQSEAYLQTLYDDPGFAPIRASQEARQKREREEFLAIVCTDNPYAAVWQPEEGTCEQFAATVGN
jgi:hypothetical protein